MIVWQKAMEVVKIFYLISKDYPKEELYGLTSQMRRSAVSIPSNIAEGYGRSTSGNYSRFLKVSLGSLYEFQTQLEIARHLDYVNELNNQLLEAKLIEISKMLVSLISKIELKRKSNS